MSKIKDYLLFCPGPVNVASNIWNRMLIPIGHREEEFSQLLSSINDKLLNVMEIKNQKNYLPLFITGSGTAANETVLASIVGQKRILVLTNGEFGERLYNISKFHNPNTVKMSFPWGRSIDINMVEQYLLTHHIDILAMVHHETSTGFLNPVAKIGKLTKQQNIHFFVDCVSSILADDIEIEEWNITYCTASSGKSLCSLPGLGIIIVEKKAIEQLKKQQPRSIYLNLYNIYQYSSTAQQTPNTPAVHLFLALEQALINILTLGVESWKKEVRNRAFILRKGLKRLDLYFLIDESNMSSMLTTVLLPEYISEKILRQKLKEKHIIIYGGKGPLINKVIQVANIGALSTHNISYFLKCMEEVLFLASQPKSHPEQHRWKVNFRRIASISHNFHFPSNLFIK